MSCEDWAGLGVIGLFQAFETGVEEPCAGSWVLLDRSRVRSPDWRWQFSVQAHTGKGHVPV